jgi:membrane protein DedA with SNARE-associated domain
LADCKHVLERFLDFGSIPLLVLGLLLAGLGLPIPEDALLLAGGALAHRTSASPWLVLPALYLGAIGADVLVYVLARRYGDALLSSRLLGWLATAKRRERVRRLLERHGSRAVFVGRHLSGLRTVVFAVAAIEGVPFRTFLFWDALGGLVTVPVVFGLGYLGSAHIAAVEADLAHFEHWVGLGAALALSAAWFLWWRRRNP